MKNQINLCLNKINVVNEIEIEIYSKYTLSIKNECGYQ